MKKILLKTFAVLIVITLIGGWFYWFQWLPYQAKQEKLRVDKEQSELRNQIVKKCNTLANFDAKSDLDFFAKYPQSFTDFISYDASYQKSYKSCLEQALREKGLEN